MSPFRTEMFLFPLCVGGHYVIHDKLHLLVIRFYVTSMRLVHYTGIHSVAQSSFS